MDDGIRHVGPITIWRCTEALDPRAGYTFRTISDSFGRCVEIASGRNTLLLDRRLARQVAAAILEICGPAEAEPRDLMEIEVLELVYNDEGQVSGFQPFQGRSTMEAAARAAGLGRDGDLVTKALS